MYLKTECIKKYQAEIANLYSREIGLLFQLPNNTEAFIEQQKIVTKLSIQLDIVDEIIKIDRNKR